MSEGENKLSSQDFSSVWKDGGNKIGDLKLDLKEHLEKQRLFPYWVNAKQTLVDNCIKKVTTKAPIRFLDIGCGLGIDMIEVAKAMANAGITGNVTGYDMNTEMVNYCTKLVEDLQGQFEPYNITFTVIKGDIFELSKQFEENSFDFVRSDITMQHLGDTENIKKALQEIQKVLKPGGIYVSLEGAVSGMFTSDSVLAANLERIMPPRTPGGIATQLYFLCPSIGLAIESIVPLAFFQCSSEMAQGDPGWVKAQGLVKMLVARNVMTQEEADDHFQRYVAAINNNALVTEGVLTILFTQKSQ